MFFHDFARAVASTARLMYFSSFGSRESVKCFGILFNNLALLKMRLRNVSTDSIVRCGYLDQNFRTRENVADFLQSLIADKKQNIAALDLPKKFRRRTLFADCRLQINHTIENCWQILASHYSRFCFSCQTSSRTSSKNSKISSSFTPLA